MPKSAPTCFTVDVALYPLEAIYAACYMFTDRAYIRLDAPSEGKVAVVLEAKADVPEKKRSNLRGEFHNELLHHALRLKISSSNQKIREYIVTQALLSAQPTSDIDKAKSEAEQAPVLDEKLEKEIEELLAQVDKESDGKDPLNIAVPWDEGSNRKAVADTGAASQTAAAVKLESEVEKLLDHAEREHKVTDPAGSPVPWTELADKVARKRKGKK